MGPAKFIGTSGFTYKHWKKVFYPEGLKEKDWLKYYANIFNSVEINASFYHLIKDSTYKKWHDETPGNFKFVLKGSRYITHIERLEVKKETLDNFINPALELRDKLSCILWQLPANFKVNSEHLTDFIKMLKEHAHFKKLRQAFEFRHRSWFSEKIYSILKNNNISLCIAHSRRWPVVDQDLADFAYFRFHGSLLYSADYSKKELNQWAKIIKRKLDENKDVYAFFNNDAFGFAPNNARKLIGMLHQLDKL